MRTKSRFESDCGLIELARHDERAPEAVAPSPERVAERAPLHIAAAPGSDCAALVAALEAVALARAPNAPALLIRRAEALGREPLQNRNAYILCAPPLATLLAAMARGIGPSEALDAWCAGIDTALAAQRRAPSQIRLARADRLEEDAPVLASLLGIAGTAPAPDADAPADPVLHLIATQALAGPAARRCLDALREAIGTAAGALWPGQDDGPDPDLAFQRHIARQEETAALQAALLAPAQRSAVTGEASAALEARIAELDAWNARARGEIAALRDAHLADFRAGPPRTQTILLLHDFTHPAFYGVETVGGRPFRWMGQEAEAVLATRVGRVRPVRVEVDVERAVDESAMAGLTLSLDGTPAQELTRRRIGENGTRLSAIFPPLPEVSPLMRARLKVHLAHRVDLTASGDPRTLGVALSRIVLEELDEAERPPFRHDLVLDGRTEHPAFTSVERRPSDTLPFRRIDGNGTAEVFLPVPHHTATVRIETHLADDRDRIAIALDGVAAETYASVPDGAGGALRSALFRLGGTAHGAPPITPSRTARITVSGETGQGPGLHKITVKEVRGGVDGASGVAPVASVAGPYRVELRAPEGFDAEAFYGLEHRDDGLPFRWMGRQGRAVLSLALPGGKAMRVAAHIATVIDDGTLRGFTFTLGGAAAQSVTERTGAGTILKSAVFAPPHDDPSEIRPVELVLHAAALSDPARTGDPRHLAVALSALVIEEVP